MLQDAVKVAAGTAPLLGRGPLGGCGGLVLASLKSRTWEVEGGRLCWSVEPELGGDFGPETAATGLRSSSMQSQSGGVSACSECRSDESQGGRKRVLDAEGVGVGGEVEEAGSPKRARREEGQGSGEGGHGVIIGSDGERVLDPVEVFGADFLQVRILKLVDAHSLARCMLVSKRWWSVAQVDALWQPFCAELWKWRAHMPAEVLRCPQMPRYQAFSVTRADIQQVDITLREACARTWEIRVKPICGSYWTLLDPTYRGLPPLHRYFRCDGSIKADPGDPIWGGNESLWRIVPPRGGERVQQVRINKWPLFRVTRFEDGRWMLENKFATYSTVPDMNAEKCPKERRICSRCGCENPSGLKAPGSGSPQDDEASEDAVEASEDAFEEVAAV